MVLMLVGPRLSPLILLSVGRTAITVKNLLQAYALQDLGIGFELVEFHMIP